MSLKARIEAVLFLTDRPIQAAAVAKIVNEDVQIVRQALLELISDYETRETGLEIVQDNGYMIQVKDEHRTIIEEFAPTDLTAALLRTLSAIALKQPVPQSEIIRIRGAGAYDHIKMLLEKELVNKEETGRSPILTTTKKFQEYFRLTSDARTLRTDIKKQEKKEDAKEAAAAAAAAGVAAGVETSETKQLVLGVPEQALPEQQSSEVPTTEPAAPVEAAVSDETEDETAAPEAAFTNEFEGVLGTGLEPTERAEREFNFEPGDDPPVPYDTAGEAIS